MANSYKLTIVTEHNNILTRTHHDLDYLIDCGDMHSTCQRYEIVNLDTGETEIDHCNLPEALITQAF